MSFVNDGITAKNSGHSVNGFSFLMAVPTGVAVL